MSESERLPSIPEPRADTQALFQTVSALKQVVELLAGQRGTAQTLRVATAAQMAENVSSLTTQIGDSQAALQADIDAVVADVAALQAEVDGYETSNDAAVLAINNQITVINGQITTLQNRCTVLENQVTEVEIADTAITAVANIDITWTAGAYRYIEFVLIGFGPATAGAANSNLRMRCYQGGTLRTGASDYQSYGPYWSGGAGAFFLAASSSFQLTASGLSATVSPSFGRVLLDPGAVNHPRVDCSFGTQANGGSFHRAIMGAPMLTRSAEVDGVRFFWESGQNFAATGRIIAKGYKV